MKNRETVKIDAKVERIRFPKPGDNAPHVGYAPVTEANSCLLLGKAVVRRLGEVPRVLVGYVAGDGCYAAAQRAAAMELALVVGVHHPEQPLL